MSSELLGECPRNGWSEEHDCMPLSSRLILLRARVPKSEYPTAAKLKLGDISVYQNDHDGTFQPQVDQMKSYDDDVIEDESVSIVNGSNNSADERVKDESLNDFDDSLDDISFSKRKKIIISRKLVKTFGRHVMDAIGNGEESKLSVPQGSGNDLDKRISTQYMRLADYLKPDDNKFSNETCHTIEECSPSTLNDSYSAALVDSNCSPASSNLNYAVWKETEAKTVDVIESSVLLARVKDEPVEISESSTERAKQNSSELIPVNHVVKSEPQFSEFLEDELDHLPLFDRIKLLSSGTPSLDMSQNLHYLNRDGSSVLDVGSDDLESVKPVSIIRPRKRRRTATNSVETALEEDAPGLLKVLIERGVLVDDIRLYGEDDSDDALDDFVEDSFSELEAVISQLFSHREPFMKFPPLRFTKGGRASYCLSCLLSLVEQTKYLQHRKWPVEWGWCRDLQSFIFVFERHNRIVLERPEYGYATYFFELLNFVPVDWQIKRLVTAMKLTSCGRITLIEDKPLMVGEDLSEGEARVLAEYGWTPNTGLGTMLNYCDRVFHDRKQEQDSSEWKSRIAKQLMNGINGGTIVSNNIPKKLLEYQGSEIVEVKIEQ